MTSMDDPSEESSRLLHELRVHHTEIEAQNEELRRTQAALEAVRQRYFDLYDLAPVGYCTLSGQGLILEANLAASTLLGVARGALINRLLAQFIPEEDQDIYYLHRKKLLEAREPQTWDLRMAKKDGTPFWVRMEASLAREEGSDAVCRVVLSDITARKQAEAVQSFLAHTSSGTTDEPFFNTLARYLAQCLGMDFCCIDRLEGDGLNARTVAVWCDGHFEDNVTYALKDTPCGDVVGEAVCAFPASVSQFFPRDQVLQDLRAESYVGVTVWNHAGRPIGLIAVIGRRPLADPSLAAGTLKLVAVRAAGEMERLDAEEALGERAKELACLYAIADVMENEVSLENILQATAELMPRGWIHDAIACARINLDGQEFKTANYRPTSWRQVSDVILLGEPVGAVELGYLEERPVRDEGPFLSEERSLINAIAERVGRVVERKRAEQQIDRARIDALTEKKRLELVSHALAESEAALHRANDGLTSANEALRRSNETLEARVAARTADLSRRTAQLQALARDLTRAEERERQRIAQVIHDHLQQLLSVARINLGIALGQVESGPMQAGLSEVDGLVAQSLEITRSLTADLSPAILHRSGLAAALRWLGRLYEDRFALKVMVEADEDAAVEEEIRVTLFRAVRELLFNVVKHAGVASARVRMSRPAEGRLRIVVSDDGVGFDPEAVRAREGTDGGFGLFSLRERLELLGGGLEVESAPGRGSSFTILASPGQRVDLEEPAPPPASALPRTAAVRKRGGARRSPARAKKR